MFQEEGFLMLSIRTATMQDKKALYHLWKICFGDEASFMDFFFEKRVPPEFTICGEIDGTIVNAMYSFPMHIRIRGKILPCATLAGFSTHPAYRSKGYMRQTFQTLMRHLYQSGILLAPHTPAVLDSYYKFGHYPVSTSAYFKGNGKNLASNCPGCIEKIDLTGDVSQLYAVYNQFSKKYSGIIARSFPDFQLKCDDYASDGGTCLTYSANKQMQAYCVYYDKEDYTYAEEVCFLSPDAEKQIIAAFINETGARNCTAKLPPDTALTSLNTEIELRPQGVMGLVNAAAVLEALSIPGHITIAVTDPVVLENNGVFTLQGQQTTAPPDISLSAGHLTQLITGYQTIEELEEQGHIQIFHRKALPILQKNFPKETCYIIDKY